MRELFESKYNKSHLSILAVLCLMLSIGLLFYNLILGVVGLVLLISGLMYDRHVRNREKKELSTFIENLATDLDATVKKNVVTNPLPICIVDKKGFIEWYNRKFGDMFQEENLIYQNLSERIPAFQIDHFLARTPGEEAAPMHVTVEDRIYHVITGDEEIDENDNMLVFYFVDVTELRDVKKKYQREKICAMRIFIDNYEELMMRSSEEKKAGLSSEIDRTIRAFAQKHTAPVIRYDDEKYYVVMESKDLDKVLESRFALLDEIRDIETDADFPVSLSIGVGVGGRDYQQTHEFSQAAIELALGRGGDQAVVRRSGKVEYFGGKSRTVEKRNKGKSRIMAQALRRIMEQSSQVLVMGHKNADMDAFGAAVGIHAFARKLNRPCSIVMDFVGESLSALYDYVSQTGDYHIIGSETALASVDKNTLLVVVDTHSPSYTECPELLQRVEKIVVIDHHRKMKKSIDNPVLAYMESYASSACELMAEIIQYIGDKNVITKVEADALLAGITLDTKHFSTQSGVRTFEAASYLRRIGADTSRVRSFFQVDQNLFRVKAKAILNAELIPLQKGGNLAITRCETEDENIGLIIAQTADEMLEIKGVKGAMVMGRSPEGQVMISARSIGDINVQVLMERMGGGGHMNTAGAQVEMSMDEAEQALRQIIQDRENEERSAK